MNSPPVSGSMPDSIGSRHRGSVTRLSGRASGRPPGPTGSPPELAGAPVVVELLHAASSGAAPDRASAAPPDRIRKSRRLLRDQGPGRSFGCGKLVLLRS